MSTAVSNSFRKDINGLRAWAVVAVVLFHFNVPGFSGGFVGVDIFFVISGYLMTQIIIRGLELGSFSIWYFYLARAKRIVPALLVLCATLLAIGWFVLPAPDYRPLGMHAMASVLFLSNIQYWRESGYFDSASHDKWLLHTWSLSVEWQFYLVLPLVLAAYWRFWPGKRNVVRLFAVGLLASFSFSIWLTASKPEAAFFLLPTRAWEMLAGGLIALGVGGGYSGKATLRKAAFEYIGFALVVLSIATAQPKNWLGYHAVLPVLGTVLVLLARSEKSFLTAPVPLQRLGDWSYSIYLWHWPLAVALAYGSWKNEPKFVGGAIALSFLFGWASYRWIEPMGRSYFKGLRAGQALAITAVFAVMVALPALVIRLGQGIPGRLDHNVEAIAAGAHDSNPSRELSHTVGGTGFKKAVFGGPAIRAIVWGDSHASTVITAVQAALTHPDHGVLAMSYTSCPTIFGVSNIGRVDLHCAAFNEWAMKQMDEISSTVPVIIVNRSSAYLFGNSFDSTTPLPSINFENASTPLDIGSGDFLSDYAKRLTASACRISGERPTYLLRPLPEMPGDVPRTLARAAMLARPISMSVPLTVYHRRHALVWAAQDKAHKECGVRILDPIPLLCKNGRCPAIDGYKTRYYDHNHMTETGNKLLVPLFFQVANLNRKSK